ncbi:MAG: type I-C CRISPR-associated protein Cas8c/Csd1 [Angelakisella sp.]|nr:type I-C CRISPR-associated protein Cas8c/Csd1 [Angelakisella sp.]
MLHELYEYAIKNQLVARPGYKLTKFKAYICLSAQGDYIGIDPAPPEGVFCPSIGSAAQGPSKCNVLVEKAGILLTKESPKKRSFFIEALRSGIEDEPLFGIVADALENTSVVEEMWRGLETAKIKPTEKISFKVDGLPLEQSKNYQGWWDAFRMANTSAAKSAGNLCFITGAHTEPTQTVPKLSGLLAVGGHSSGDALVCFDKAAFCSYDLKKAENATVSEEGITSVNAALEHLLRGAPTLAGAKWLHWYKDAVLPQEDPIPGIFGDVSPLLMEDEVEEGEEAQNIAPQLAIQGAKRLVESARSGQHPELLHNQYYILSLSGASGRVMVRNWMQGSYEELYEALWAWYDDLALCNPSGKGMCKDKKLFIRNIRLLKVEKGNNKFGDRMTKELAGLQQQILFACIKGTPLPDAVASRSLQYIRSDLYAGSDDNQAKDCALDSIACQWLKIWLIRKVKQEGGIVPMSASCNPEYPSKAYQSGRMMAVYAAIQTEAMGKNLGAGIIQRYYTSASTSPALVLGRLSTLSQYHLSKMDNRYWASRYEDILGEISQKMEGQAPTTLTLQQQSEFALGYYQERAELQQLRYAKKAASEEVLHTTTEFEEEAV